MGWRGTSPPWATDDSPARPPDLSITDSLTELLDQHGLQQGSGICAVPPLQTKSSGIGGTTPQRIPSRSSNGSGTDRSRDVPTARTSSGGSFEKPRETMSAGSGSDVPVGGYRRVSGGATASQPRSPHISVCEHLSARAPKVDSNGTTAGSMPDPCICDQNQLNSKTLYPAAQTAPRWGPCLSGQLSACVSVALDPNTEFRTYMEDGHKICEPLFSSTHKNSAEAWGFYAVFDGHGGQEEMKYCEAKMHDIVHAELRALAPGKDVRDALIATFKKIDGQLAMLGAWNSGCTATVALVHRHDGKTRLYVANVGDSRAVLATSRASQRLSTDHRACDAAEAKRVTEDGGVVRYGRVGGQLSVSRSLGDHHLKNSGLSCIPDISVTEVGPGENALVIASDGLWDTIDDDCAAFLIDGVVSSTHEASGSNPVAKTLKETCAAHLVKEAKKRGSRDNILAMVVFL